MIFKNEMKRILRPSVLIIIACLTIIWYFAFMTGCNIYLKNDLGQPYAVAKEYARRFGPSIDGTEIDEVRADYEKAALARDAVYDKYLGQYGIHSQEEYEDYRENNYDIFMNEKSDLHKQALAQWGEEEYEKRKKTYEEIFEIASSDDVFNSVFYPQAIYSIIEEWEMKEKEKEAFKMDSEDWYFSDASESAKEWLEGFLNEENEVSLLTLFRPEYNFQYTYSNWNLLILICCALVTLPYLVRNNINNVTAMLYSSKKGRKMIASQFLAVIASNAVIIAVLTCVFQMFYFKEDTSFLFHARINSAVHSAALWLDLTYLQYMILSWAETFILSLCAVVLMFWISYYSKNYVTAMAAAVPVVMVFRSVLEQLNKTLRIFDGYPHYLFWLCFSVPIMISVVVSMVMKHRTGRSDYLIG